MINAKDSKYTFYILNKKVNIPLVLIHGVGLNHKIWEPQINSFNNTVLVYDILGHGNTPLTKSQISFDDFSLQLLSLIDELMEHVNSLKFEYRHKWEVGDFVVWDNRILMHKANGDYDMSENRYLYRLMLQDD